MIERLNRTIVEKAKCLLFDADLGKCSWAEAVYTAVYLRNPYEMWTIKKPNVSHIRIFGSKAIFQKKNKKLDKKSKKMIFVGFSDNIKGYRLYDPDEKVIYYE